MARIRYQKLSYRTPCILKEPGGVVKNARTGQRERSEDINHTGYFCNFRVRSASERLVSGVDITKKFSTLMFRYQPIFNRVDASWKVIINGTENNIIGGVEFYEPGRQVRLNVEEVA